MGRIFFFLGSEGAPRALRGPGAGTDVSSGQTQAMGAPEGQPPVLEGLGGGHRAGWGQAGGASAGASAFPGTAPWCVPWPALSQ